MTENYFELQTSRLQKCSRKKICQTAKNCSCQGNGVRSNNKRKILSKKMVPSFTSYRRENDCWKSRSKWWFYVFLFQTLWITVIWVKFPNKIWKKNVLVIVTQTLSFLFSLVIAKNGLDFNCFKMFSCCLDHTFRQKLLRSKREPSN